MVGGGLAALIVAGALVAILVSDVTQVSWRDS